MPLDVRMLRRITWYVAGASLALTGLMFALGGLDRGVGAAIGGVVAVLNWMGMQWIGERLVHANDRGRVIWGTLLAVKMGSILGVVMLILSTGWVDPIGFGVGMSGLVLGALGGAFRGALSGEAMSAPDAGEEN